MSIIELRNVKKDYIISKKRKGMLGALVNLFKSEKRVINAVDDINFTIKEGEIVGYIGPNGAGKSTTIKMMSGILLPTQGEILINGISPKHDRKKVVQELGVVFGQRSQLYWDLRLGESFELLKRIYRVPDAEYRKNLDELIKVMDIADFIDTPVRQLSLGQRMRGELVAAMIHSPKILFLDEPTIGLDIKAKKAIRQFILDINRLKKTTVVLTTHDLEDVSELCDRLIVINHGKIVEDGNIKQIIDKMCKYRIIDLHLDSEISEIKNPNVEVLKIDETKVRCRFEHSKISASSIIKELSNELNIIDLSVKEADIEDAILQIYE